MNAEEILDLQDPQWAEAAIKLAEQGKRFVLVHWRFSDAHLICSHLQKDFDYHYSFLPVEDKAVMTPRPKHRGLDQLVQAVVNTSVASLGRTPGSTAWTFIYLRFAQGDLG